MLPVSPAAEKLAFEFVLLNLLRQLMLNGALSRPEILAVLEAARMDARQIAATTRYPHEHQEAREAMDLLDEMKEFKYWD